MVFKLDPAGKENVLWSFTGKTRGALDAKEAFIDNFLGMLHLGCCLILLRHSPFQYHYS